MRLLRFEAGGLLNSFRIPFFRTYHKTALAPPKTAVVGLLCNVTQKPPKEFFDILDSDVIKVSVVVEELRGRVKDIWSYRKLSEKKNRGRSVVRRDRLFGACYTIYVVSEDDRLFEELLDGLRSPKAVPAFGMDDELVVLDNIEEIEPKSVRSKRVDSVFLDEGREFVVRLKEPGKVVEMPSFVYLPVKFEAFDKKGRRKPKEPKEFVRQVEFYNCYVEFEEAIDLFTDGKNNFLLY